MRNELGCNRQCSAVTVTTEQVRVKRAVLAKSDSLWARGSKRRVRVQHVSETGSTGIDSKFGKGFGGLPRAPGFLRPRVKRGKVGRQPAACYASRFCLARRLPTRLGTSHCSSQFEGMCRRRSHINCCSGVIFTVTRWYSVRPHSVCMVLLRLRLLFGALVLPARQCFSLTGYVAGTLALVNSSSFKDTAPSPRRVVARC